MGTTTTNYAFYKPAGTDLITVGTDINNNMDDIDTEIKAIQTRIDSLPIPISDILIVKTANTQRTTETYSDDPHLTTTISSTGVYLITIYTFGLAATDDFKYGLTLPTVTTVAYGADYAANYLGLYDRTTPIEVSNVAYHECVEHKILANFSGTGTFALKWAMNAPTGDGTIYAGSYMILRKIA